MKDLVRDKIIEAVKKSGYNLPRDFDVSEPPKPEMGDFATNIAMLLASKEQKLPREIADKIKINLEKNKQINRVEIAGPGFINIFLSDEVYKTAFSEILKNGDAYGRRKKTGKKASVEYISANPTGPLHIGNARGGPIGEAVANLLEFLGFDVKREFYINDIGGQIERFAESLYYWYSKKIDDKTSFPEGGYPGEYVKEISEKIERENKPKIDSLSDKQEIVELFKKEGLYHTVKSIREDAKLLDIAFDEWTCQSDFQHSNKTEQIITTLENKGATTTKEGALWFKNPDDPELLDKESVLRKSDIEKTLTYFADDIAYHASKYEASNSLIIDVWGANHSGHVPRMKAAIRSLGFDDKKFKIILYQYVRLKNAGKVMSMGKRLGNFVTLREVIKSGVKPDAFKYFVLSQNPNTPFDFDIQLAADTSEKNPVFYIKYAHARIASILKKAGEGSSTEKGWDFELLKDKREKALYKELVKFPSIIKTAEENFQIQIIPHYAYKLAGLFHDFYANCQVLDKDKKITATRLALVKATKIVLKNSLEICDIEAPDKM